MEDKSRCKDETMNAGFAHVNRTFAHFTGKVGKILTDVVGNICLFFAIFRGPISKIPIVLSETGEVPANAMV